MAAKDALCCLTTNRRRSAFLTKQTGPVQKLRSSMDARGGAAGRLGPGAPAPLSLEDLGVSEQPLAADGSPGDGD